MMKSCLSFCLVTFSICISANADERTIARFEAEYPLAAERLTARLEEVRGTYSIRYSKDSSRTSTFDFAISGGNERLIETFVDRSSKGPNLEEVSVFLLTGDSFFRLNRRTPEGKFVLRDRGKRETKGLDFENYQGMPYMAMLGGRPAFLRHLLNAPNAKVVDAKVEDPKTGHVTVVLRFGPREPMGECRYVLDPANGWAVISQETKYPGQTAVSFRMNVTYGDRIMGFAMPKRVSIRQRENPAEVYEFSEWKFTSTPAEEFTTEHYGLGSVKPAPVRSRRSNSRTLALWVLIPAVLTGLSFTAYRRFIR